MNFKSKRWQILLLLSLIFLSIGIFIKFAIGTDMLSQNIRSMFLGSFSKIPFKKQSEVKVYLIDSKLNLDFNLIDEDKLNFSEFIRNWFGVNEEVNNLSLGIDKNIESLMTASLPAELKLTVGEKSLGFNSNLITPLQNALIKNNFEFATGSSKLRIQYTDSSKYQLKIDDPSDLVNYATSSGKLATSSKLLGLFQTLPKIATIELNVNGKNVSGSIKLK